MVCRAVKSWDARRKVAIENLKKQIEKYSKQHDEQGKDLLNKASVTLARTEHNLGKGLTALKNKDVKVEVPR